MLVSQVVTQRDAHLLNTREMSAAFREAYPAASAPAAGRRRSPLRRDDGRRARRRPGLQPGHDARRGRLVHRPPARRPGEGLDDSTPAPPTTAVGTAVTHRRYVPYSHAHYAGNLVDGAYSLGLFGDVATEMCIVPTATRASSRPTPTSSSRPRCGPATSWRSPRPSSARAPAAGSMDFAVRVVGVGRRPRRARCRRGPRPAGRGDHRHRHRRRTSRTALVVGVSRPDTPIQVKFLGDFSATGTSLTCDNARSGRSEAC